MSRCRKNLIGPNILRLQDLQEYAHQKSFIPEDEDEPYVIHFKVGKLGKFILVWTTKKLLMLCKNQEFLQVLNIYCIYSDRNRISNRINAVILL